MEMTNKYNVLILTDTFMGMAGSERNITQLLKGIDKEKFNLYMACIYSGQLAQEMREEGHSVFDLLRGGIYTVNGIKNIFFLRRLIKNKNISLIVTYHETSDFYGLILAKACNIPVISSRRDMGFKTRSHHKMAYKLIGGFFDREITVCDAVKQEIVKQGWFPEKRIVSIYNGVDLREYNTCRRTCSDIKKEIGIDPAHPVVGLVANLRRIKGITYLIEAASRICKRRSDVEFLIAGSDTTDMGYSISSMQTMAEKLGVSRNVHFLGRRRDVPEIISIFDVAVVASLSEGFSNTILEYMASSKPVVATTVGGNAEAVVQGETGFLVPPGDSHALAEAIWSILDDPITAQQFSTAAKKRVEEKFSLEHMIENYETIFKQVILTREN